MNLLRKLKLSLIMADWDIRGWIDGDAPLQIKLIFWTIYHLFKTNDFERKHGVK